MRERIGFPFKISDKDICFDMSKKKKKKERNKGKNKLHKSAPYTGSRRTHRPLYYPR